MFSLNQLFIIYFLLYSLVNLFFYSQKSKKLIQKYFYQILAFILLIQLIFIFFINYFRYEVGDVMLFSGAGHYLSQKIDFYFIDANHEQYPFFPFLIFLYAPLNLLSTQFPFLTFSTLLKLFILLPCLYFLSHLISSQEKKTSKLKVQQKQIQLLTNPLVLSVVLFHGQIDIILLSFLIYSFLYLFQDSLKKNLIGIVLYSFSILAKTWSVIFTPLILKFQKNILKTFLSTFISLFILLFDIFVYTRFVFGSGFKVVIPALSMAGGPIGHWGIPFILNLFNFNISFLAQNSLIIFAILFLLSQLIILTQSKINLNKAAMLTILSFYIIMFRFGIQYLFWIIPFIFLDKDIKFQKEKNIFILISSFLNLFTYLNVIQSRAFIPVYFTDIISLILWIFCIYWFYREIKYVK